MTYTLELSPEIEERVRAAQERGIDIDARLIEAIVNLPAEPDETAQIAMPTPRSNPAADAQLRAILERNRPTPEALAAFSAEVQARDEALARMTPDEIADSERETNELLHALNRNRREAGERPLYPE